MVKWDYDLAISRLPAITYESYDLRIPHDQRYLDEAIERIQTKTGNTKHIFANLHPEQFSRRDVAQKLVKTGFGHLEKAHSFVRSKV